MNRSIAAAAVLVAVAAVWFSGRVYTDTDRARAVAETAIERADSVALVADSLRGRAEARHARAADTRDRVRALPVPDTCIVVVAPRDSIIDDLEGAYALLDSAYTVKTGEVSLLRLATDSLLAAQRRDWWKPEIGIGPFLGICTGGTPCAGVGITLSWRVP